jgi:hypothetical protein
MTTDSPTMQAIIQDGYGAPERVLRLDQTAVAHVLEHHASGKVAIAV